MKITYAIIDDDPEAVKSLQFFIEVVPGNDLELTEVGVRNDLNPQSEEDIEFINSVDVLFLDIMLKGKNSLDLISQIKDIQPSIIITTGHDNFMLKAIRLSAFDYLMKPVSKTNFEQMLNRLNERIEKDFNKMLEWMRISKAVSPNDLNEEQSRKVMQISSPLFDELTKKYPVLTLSEKRMLVLIKLGFDNSEIARHLFMEQDSVRRIKLRLKKRMNIPKGEHLETVLAKL